MKGHYVSHLYVDIAEDLVAGALLTRIMQLFGEKECLTERDGREWLPRKRTDWWEDLRFSVYRYDVAIARLKKMGLVETRRYKVGEDAITCIRPTDKLNELAADWLVSHGGVSLA